jgi:hypothetical protein
MSSGGGPRAGGSGIKEEGKFRQRVDDHYRKMAEAKRSIGAAGRLQLASALGLGTVAGVTVTLPETSAMLAAGVSALLMLVSGGCARAATAATGGKDTEKHAAAYAGWLKILGMMLVLAVGGAGVIGAAELLEPPPRPLVAALGAVAAVDMIGCVLGLNAASKMASAFEAQKKKATMKAT